MLNERDVAIIRAALTFLDDEFFPDQEQMFQHYLDDRGVQTGASTKHIKATRAKLSQAELYLAIKQMDRDELVSPRLFPLPSADEITYRSDREFPVAVIVTGN